MDFVYYSDIIHLTTYATAVTLRTPHNALLRKAAQFSDLRLLFRTFFRRPKERTKENAIYHCGGNNRPWDSTNPTPSALEMRHRLTRCTCTSQNEAIAPQIRYDVSNHEF